MRISRDRIDLEGGRVDNAIVNDSTLSGSTIASQAEAEAGTDNTKATTPLRVAQAIAALGGGATLARKTANQTSTSSTLADITGMTFAIGANETWLFEALLGANGATTGSSPCVSVNGPASPSSVSFSVERVLDGGIVSSQHTAYDAVETTALAGNGLIRVSGLIVNGANAGTVALRFRRSGTSSTATVYINSLMRAWKQ